MEIACPLCDAKPGEPCYDPNGRLPYKDKHAERVEAAMRPRDLIEEHIGRENLPRD